MNNLDFKTYDPISQLIAFEGGNNLPLTGGTLMGNLTMALPYKVIQCQTPSNPCDVVNLIYLQSLYLPLTGGTMNGVINQPSPPASPTELVNKAYVDSLIAGGPFLPLSGGTMTGEILQPLAPSIGNSLVNKTYVDAQITPDATTIIKGKIQLAGDLSGTANLPVIDVNKVTYPKIQQVGASSLLGNSTGSLANTQEITLGSLVFTSNVLNSPISFYGGIDPNLTTPTDRPSTNNTLYIGTDNNIWIWTGLLYMAISPKKYISFSKNLNNQTMVAGDSVQFGAMVINRTSTQGLTITDFTNGSLFTVTLEVNRAPILLKLTVSISALNTPSTIAKFFTYNVTTASFTGGPGLILNNNALVTVTGTHTYSEILPISPGSTNFEVQLLNITGTTPIVIGSGIPLPYRWILFEEV